jgi:hypothetical protein
MPYADFFFMFRTSPNMAEKKKPGELLKFPGFATLQKIGYHSTENNPCL